MAESWIGFGRQAGECLAGKVIEKNVRFSPFELERMLERWAVRICREMLAADCPESTVVEELDSLERTFYARLEAWGASGGRA